MDMIEIHALTKRYGSTTAVADLTFTVQPGTVTGFLGPNGAGKSTTMRMILGLDQPTSGTVLVNGRAPRAHAAPLHEIGGMIDPRAVHPSRHAYHHLLALAQTSGIRKSRVDEVIEAVGLRSVANRPAGNLIVIGKGRLIADTTVADFIASAAPGAVRVRSSDQPALAGLLRMPDVTVIPQDDGALAVSGLTAAQIGASAAAAGITVLELATEQASLEDVFVDLTKDAVEYRAARPARSVSEEKN
jgi:ABC-type multidrug transport system ATPase subunit